MFYHTFSLLQQGKSLLHNMMSDIVVRSSATGEERESFPEEDIAQYTMDESCKLKYVIWRSCQSISESYEFQFWEHNLINTYYE